MCVNQASCLRRSVIELSKSLIETYDRKLQLYSGDKSVILHYFAGDSFVYCFTIQSVTVDLKNISSLFYKKVASKFRKQKPETVFVDKLAVRNERYA